MFSIARYAWRAPAMLSIGCADRQLPLWPAAAEIPAEGEPALTVASLDVRTADVTPPAWAEDCDLTSDRVEPGSLAAGVELTWCAATDNDRVHHFELRSAGGEPMTLPPDQLSFVRTEEPVDGTYIVSACDPSGNCAALPSEYVGLKRAAMMEALHAEILETSSLLALALALDDPDKEVRQWAAWSLGLVGPSAATPVEDLRAALTDPESWVRKAAAEALLVLGDEGDAARATLVLRRVADEMWEEDMKAMEEIPHLLDWE